MVDIIFSLTAHTSPECLVDTIQNIKFFNKEHAIKIIINSNEFIYTALHSHHSDVIFYPKPWNKNYMGVDLTYAHLQNFTHCKENHIVSTYFIPLASNCMFYRKLTLAEIEVGLRDRQSVTDLAGPITLSGQARENIYRNEKIVLLFKEIGISNIKKQQHEGFVIEYDIFNKITDFIYTHWKKEFLSFPIHLEEILIITLYTYFTNKSAFHICKIFWNLKNYTPSIQDILTVKEPCVKRVLLDYSNPIRVWLRSLQQ